MFRATIAFNDVFDGEFEDFVAAAKSCGYLDTPGWNMSIQATIMNRVVLIAERAESEDLTPSHYLPWVEIKPEVFCLVLGEGIDG